MNEPLPPVGSILWRDLTVKDAEGIRDFYTSVVGWQWAGHDMGEYEDFDILLPDGGEVITGICHARGSNADLPPVWLMYIIVEDVEKSAQKCRELGGEILTGPRRMGGNLFCVIRDPAGAVCALFSQKPVDTSQAG